VKLHNARRQTVGPNAHLVGACPGTRRRLVIDTAERRCARPDIL
jgi:hypothetical protein